MMLPMPGEPQYYYQHPSCGRPADPAAGNYTRTQPSGPQWNLFLHGLQKRTCTTKTIADASVTVNVFTLAHIVPEKQPLKKYDQIRWEHPKHGLVESVVKAVSTDGSQLTLYYPSTYMNTCTERKTGQGHATVGRFPQPKAEAVWGWDDLQSRVKQARRDGYNIGGVWLAQVMRAKTRSGDDDSGGSDSGESSCGDTRDESDDVADEAAMNLAAQVEGAAGCGDQPKPPVPVFHEKRKHGAAFPDRSDTDSRYTDAE